MITCLKDNGQVLDSFMQSIDRKKTIEVYERLEKRLDAFFEFDEHKNLYHEGKVVKAIAVKIAIGEHDELYQYRIVKRSFANFDY